MIISSHTPTPPYKSWPFIGTAALLGCSILYGCPPPSNTPSLQGRQVTFFGSASSPVCPNPFAYSDQALRGDPAETWKEFFFLERAINDLLTKNSFKEAVELTKKIPIEKDRTSQKLINDIAIGNAIKSYLEEGFLDQALEIAPLIDSNYLKESAFSDGITPLLEKENFEGALKLASFLPVAHGYYQAKKQIITTLAKVDRFKEATDLAASLPYYHKEKILKTITPSSASRGAFARFQTATSSAILHPSDLKKAKQYLSGQPVHKARDIALRVRDKTLRDHAIHTVALMYLERGDLASAEALEA